MNDAEKVMLLRDAIAEFIIEMDKVMVGPSTRERGERIARMIGDLQDAWDATEQARADRGRGG